jgi:hypothetical protein
VAARHAGGRGDWFPLLWLLNTLAGRAPSS